ncbi:major facilitator superfamily domain-containing protein [Aspergillus keveii]|uniref:Major facilitator superfamily domain-containing protein n=1 Tax=Aspergillus keveii TaxID=714993 RepID=A0ABR4G9T4_9EURO
MPSKFFPNTITECLFVLTVTFAFAQSTIFSGMATVMTDVIGRDLNMQGDVVWITSAALLTNGAFVLPLGTLSDTLGRKPLALTAMILTTLATLACGFAPDGVTLIVFTALMGLFSAAAITPAVGTLGAVYSVPSKRRNRAFACFSAGNPLGFVVGTLIAGVVLEITRGKSLGRGGFWGGDDEGRDGDGGGWRVCFWVFCVLTAGFGVLVKWTVPKDKVVFSAAAADGGNGSGSEGDEVSRPEIVTPARVGAWEVLRRFDLVGAVLVTAGVSALSAGLTLTGTAPQGWGTSYVIVLIIAGVVLIGVFIFWQSIYKFPLMPLYIWRDRNFSLVIILLATGNAAFTSSSFWLCLYLQRTQRLSALWIAVYLLPQNINGLIINFICSLILHRVSHRVLMGVGALAYLVSFLLLALLQPIRYYYWAFVFPSLVLAVVGADLQFNVANSYVMSSLPRHQQSLAGGILSAVNKLLSNIALSISTAVYYAGQKHTARNGTDGDSDDFAGYRAAFWLLVAIAGVNLALVPFLRIKKVEMEDMKRPTEEEGTRTSSPSSGSEEGFGEVFAEKNETEGKEQDKLKV